MTNVNTTIDPQNPDEITIDISGITAEQRRLLKLSCKYPEQVPNPDFNSEEEISEENPEMIPNPIPLLVWVIKDSMENRVKDMKYIELEERKTIFQETLQETPSALEGFFTPPQI
jgi:hypothetical protein